MSFLDDALNQIPGGVAKPLAIALGALLLKNMMGGGAPAGGSSGGSSGASDGGLVGGLGELITKFQKGGKKETIDSWVSDGPNQPIEPGQLGSVLGQQTLSDIARRAGMSEQELLQQLSQVLPNVVDKLTPSGRMPGASGSLPSGFGRI